MGAPKVKIGERYGRLVTNGILRKDGLDGARVWACQCDCGRVTQVKATALSSGSTKSCGCIRSEQLRVNGVEGRLKSQRTKKLNRVAKIYEIYFAARKAHGEAVKPWSGLSETEQKIWMTVAERLYLRSNHERVAEAASGVAKERAQRNRGADPGGDGRP